MKKVLLGIISLISSFTIFAQVEDDVIINEYVVNPATGKEYVELLVVGNNVNLQGWTLSDVSSRTGNSGTTEGDITLPANATYLASVPRGTYIVLEFTTPTANSSVLYLDTSITDTSTRKMIIQTSTSGVTLSGVIDAALSENFQLYAGSRATGTLIDQILSGTNTSYFTGATWGDNTSSTNTDNINGGLGLSSGSAIRFVPASASLAGFQDNDAGSRFVVDATSYGSPGMTNAGVNDFGGLLPVSFKSFTSTRSNNSNLLRWTTATETNNSGFEVQRSVNNGKYEVIGFVKGAGNSRQLRNYSFTDAAKLTGNVCYRLRQIDFNGNSELSKSTCVNISEEKITTEVLPTPNPFNNSLQINYATATEGNAHIEVVDMLGKVQLQTNEHVNKGANSIHLNTETLPLGIYFLRVSQGGEVLTKRIVKK